MPKRRRPSCSSSSKSLPSMSHGHAIVTVAPVLLLFLTVRDLAFVGAVDKWWNKECKHPTLLDHKKLGLHVRSQKPRRLPPRHILPIITKLSVNVIDMSSWTHLVSDMVHLRHLDLVSTGLVLGQAVTADFAAFFRDIPASVRVLSYDRPTWYGLIILSTRRRGRRTFPLLGIKGLDLPSSDHFRLPAPNITALKTSVNDPCPRHRGTPNLRFIHLRRPPPEGEEIMWSPPTARGSFSVSDLQNVETIITNKCQYTQFSQSVSSSLKHLRTAMRCLKRIITHFGFDGSDCIFNARCESLHTLEILVLWLDGDDSYLSVLGRLSSVLNSIDYPRLGDIRVVFAFEPFHDWTLPSVCHLLEGVTIHWSLLDIAFVSKPCDDMLDLAFKDISPLGTAQQAFDRYVDNEWSCS